MSSQQQPPDAEGADANAILEPAATRVRDPRSGRSAWMARLIEGGRVEGDTLRFTLKTTRAHSAEDREKLKGGLLRQIEAVGWKGQVVIQMSVVDDAPPAAPRPLPGVAPEHRAHDHSHSHAHGQAHDHGHDHAQGAPAAGGKKKDPVAGMSGPGMGPHGGPIVKQPLNGVKHIIAVASGKGGVGKSTVATNLAVALARRGLRIGLMDADIYGPSLPLMMGVSGKPFANDDKKIVPLLAHGVKCMSIGFLVDEREPVIWRGPMVMGVVRQFLQEVDWNPLDLLIIDLPPGTGDAQLTMIQAVDLAGALIVTTPQQVAVIDAMRGVEMFRKLNVPVLGVVENMSFLPLPDGSVLRPFGRGGGQQTADTFEVPLLAMMPLDEEVREGGDLGKPVALRDDTHSRPWADVGALVAEALGL
jgi:ATP-binding protein involved in chromosome partitioning